MTRHCEARNRSWSLSVALALATGAWLAASAGCSSSPAAQGAEGQHCFRNGTCDVGLICLNDLCVQAADGGMGGRGGTTGRGGSGGGTAGGGAGTGGAIAGAGGSVGGSAGSAGTSGGAGGPGGAIAGSGGATGGSNGGAGSGGAMGGRGGSAGTGGATAGTGGATAGAGGGGRGGATAGTGGGGTGGATAGTGGGGTGGATAGAGGGGTGGSGPTCGNGQMEIGETCDDANRNAGDGCGYLCQIEADWQCLTPGSPCTLTAVCGDGVLASREVCDDGNANGGDGCAGDCKSVDPGYACRVPGRRCVPLCGDGMRIGAEACDDGNTTADDGCSAVCQIEPGASCTGTPSVCTKAVCGNGVKEGTEACDCGTSNTNLPVGCKGPNGAFFGDATGCSRTCTREPSCRSGTGATQACATSCGNGSIETGEGCDDGNTAPGDGCSSTCTVEAGFTCAAELRAATETCQSGSGQCMHLPAVLRDFKNESVSGGHPDFFYMSSTVANPVSISNVDGQGGPISFTKRYCVPDAAGPAKRQDAVNRAWDLAQAGLGASGKPVFNGARTNGTLSPCQFIDWSDNGNGGHVPGYTTANSPLTGLVFVDGAQGHKMYRGLAPAVTSAASFAQWFVDSTYTNDTHSTTTLELTSAGGTLYRMKPNPHTLYGGFFPLDPPGQFPAAGGPGGPGAIRTVGTEAMGCNIWPYWYSTASFGADNNCRADQYLFPPSVDGTLYPGGMWLTNGQGWFHDFWFTTEVRTTFAFTGTFSLDVASTDDLWVYINGMLVIDLGGTHQHIPGHVDVGANGMASTIEGGRISPTSGATPACPSADPYTGLTTNGSGNTDGNGHANCVTADCDCRSRNVNLGLQAGRSYELAIFAADRHTTQYDLDIGLALPPANVSACLARCGDAARTGGEQCDCGDTTPSADPWCAGRTNDGSYAGCTTQCRFAPYCGDGVVDSSNGEQCDLGTKNNTGSYGTGGCTPGCRTPRRCGDGLLDTTAGEQCDLGDTVNGTAGSPCSIICRIATP